MPTTVKLATTVRGGYFSVIWVFSNKKSPAEKSRTQATMVSSSTAKDPKMLLPFAFAVLLMSVAEDFGKPCGQKEFCLSSSSKTKSIKKTKRR